MKKTRSLYTGFVSLVIIVVVLSACGPTTTTQNCAAPEVFCVGLVTDVGKIDDQALNQLAWEGLKRAELKLGAVVQYIETIDSRDYEKNMVAFANAGYDLIITVGFAQRQATLNIARRYPAVNFIGIDQPLDPDKALPDNLAALTFSEDQAGFLAGALAAQMTQTGKIGAVCGPDSFPPAWRYCEGFKAGAQYIISPPVPTPTPAPAREAPTEEEPIPDEEPTEEEPIEEEPPEEEPEEEEPEEEEPEEEPTEEEEEEEEEEIARKRSAGAGSAQEEEPTPEAPDGETPTVEVTVMYHNEIAFSDSIVDPKWDAESANTLIDNGADVIFGSASYGENGAVSAAAKRGAYAIGVNTDEFLTLPDAQNALLSSAVKLVAIGVFDMVKAAQNGEFERGNFAGNVGYAPHHNLTNRVPGAVKKKMAEIQTGLNDGFIETDVPPAKPASDDAEEEEEALVP